MRVGVHTGTVLCGIVGKKRFKFDVWSNDVSLANQMESTGKPGRVHISQATAQFLGEIYVLEEGEPLHGLNTYFIKGRKADITYESFLRQKSSKIFPVLIAPPPSSPLLAPQSRPREGGEEEQESHVALRRGAVLAQGQTVALSEDEPD
uniref:adenylate cyclase n=1 Tax=Timema genevievae TaxID=629358 RepID=A0A7R9PMF9_TIMGE|nr:unnamed protein product [Timema genevievae]